MTPTKRNVLYTGRFLDISQDKENSWLHLDWKGYQTDRSIKDGCYLALDLMGRHNTFKILNDNTNVLGIWTGVAKWLISDALPRARQAGMTSLAHVYGPSRLSRISAEAALFLLNAKATDIKTFEDMAAAEAWLKSRSRSLMERT